MPDFDWTNPYPTIRAPVFARNIVSTSHPLASEAGLQVLRAGGNAADAAIAAAAVLTICEPVACGLGSDCFAMVWDGALHGLNASGAAPARWSLDYFKARHGVDANGLAKQPRRGWDSVTVPGVVAGWSALHERFGRQAFASLFESAISIAEDGYGVTPIVAQKWAAAVKEMRDQPGFAQAFLPDGRAPLAGERFRFPEAATTLKAIAQSHGEDFYHGLTARKIADFSQACGAALTLEDLQACRADWVQPISRSYRGFDVHELPPNGQGIAALMALGILEHLDPACLRRDEVVSQHVQIEAVKLAFADLYRYVADPSGMQVKVAQMLDDDYLAARARLIRLDRAGDFGPGALGPGGTVYLTVADRSGMMVSLIQSNCRGFGSGVVVPGTGISLHNRALGFSMDPHAPNVVKGGVRPFHTIIPAFLTRHGQPVMSFGVKGGDMQAQGHVQTIVRMLDFAQNPQAACCAPRWRIGERGVVNVEDKVDRRIAAGLSELGHDMRLSNDYPEFGSGQFIWRMPESDGDIRYVGASDSRTDGQAVGFG